MAIIEKEFNTLEMSAVCPNHSRTDVSVRDLVVTIDEPERRGGTNLGPTPTETLMISLVACSNVISNRLADAQGIEISDLKIDIKYDFYIRGANLKEIVDIPFTNIVLTLTCNATGTPEQFQYVKDNLSNYCPIAKTLTAGGHGAKIEEVWNVTHV